MSQIRIKNAAAYLGVSDDTVRRWIENGTLSSSRDDAGRTVVDGLELARLARNRFVGLVTEVITDTVMAQVELQCGPHRVVSLMSSEAVRELGLEPGVPAIAIVKATTVIIETPPARP